MWVKENGQQHSNKGDEGYEKQEASAEADVFDRESARQDHPQQQNWNREQRPDVETPEHARFEQDCDDRMALAELVVLPQPPRVKALHYFVVVNRPGLDGLPREIGNRIIGGQVDKKWGLKGAAGDTPEIVEHGSGGLPTR